eukprot:1093987-Prymnesium_polylepis.1
MRIGADVRPSEDAAMPKAEPCAPAVVRSAAGRSDAHGQGWAARLVPYFWLSYGCFFGTYIIASCLRPPPGT